MYVCYITMEDETSIEFAKMLVEDVQRYGLIDEEGKMWIVDRNNKIYLGKVLKGGNRRW